VVVIPGERNYFLASDNELHLNISKGVEATGIETEFVNPGYIDDDLLKQNSQLIMREISGGSAKINQDLTPLAYFLQINYWLSIWKAKVWFIAILMLMLLLILVLSKSIGAVGAGILAGGFAGASAEFLVIIVYQILYGYVYQMLGIIIAFYMTGLTAGAIMVFVPGQESLTDPTFLADHPVANDNLLSIPDPIPVRFSNMPEWTGQALLLIITGLIALVTGLEFNMASRLKSKKSKIQLVTCMELIWQVPLRELCWFHWYFSR